jgi:CheY-like chemotaxis protein
MGDQRDRRRQRVDDGAILLVEDNADDIELTLRALNRTGLTNEVVTVRDGAQALDYLRREGNYVNRAEGRPALILLDVKLPRVDGLEVLDQIKSDPDLKSLPVVMLTSSNHERDVMRAYQLGVNSYICKPTDFSEFQQVINTLGRYWFNTVVMPTAS